MLPALRRSFPKLKLFLHEDMTESLHRQLLEGTLDVATLALPYDLTGVEQLPLFNDRFRLAARAGTKLVEPTTYRFNRLNEGTVLLLREGHCMRDHAIEACKLRDTRKTSRFSASSLLTLIEMVDADLGVTFLPEMAEGSALLHNTQVRTYPLSDKSYRTVALIWRRGSARADEFRTLGKFIAEHREGLARSCRAATRG